MPLTPKTSRTWLTRGAVLAGVVALLGWSVTHFPKPPQAPRYVGAGDDTPRNGGTLRFAEGSNIHTLDPHIAYDTLSTAAVRLLYDGLLDYDFEAKFVPSIASELPTVSDDGRTFLFSLRTGVKFHNGRELTAEDVSWSLHRLLSEALGSPGYPFYKSIEGASEYHTGKAERVSGITVIDPYTIEFRLKEADQTFLNAMAMTFSYPMPQEAVEAAEAAEGVGAFGKHPVGVGPFRFVRWERGVQVEFARFEEHFDPQPRVDRIVFLENVSNHVATARFRNGDLDIHYRPARVDNLFFRESVAWAPYRVEFASPSIFALTLNCGLAPFDDVHVRRAFAFAIDRTKIQRFDPIRYLPAEQLLPPGLPGHFEDLQNKQVHDLERAKEEMRLAGHPDGLEEPVEIWVRGKGDSQMVQLIREDLLKIGIDLKEKMVSFATYLKETGKPRVAQAAFSGWHADFPDPSNFMDILFHTRAIHPENSENRSFYRNPKLDRLLDAARKEQDPTKRLEMYREASETLAHDAPWAYLFYPLDSFVWQPYVKNFRVHPVWSQHYRNLWLDLPRRRQATEPVK